MPGVGRYRTSGKADVGFHGGVGTAAERTAWDSPEAGAQFFETDTNTLYIYNGSSWIKIPSADDEAYGQYIYDGAGSYFTSGYFKISFNGLLNSKNLSLSGGSIIFSKPGVYEFGFGHRFGTGSDVWTGCGLYNETTGVTLARSYGTGQVGGADPGPVNYQFLATIANTAQTYALRVYRSGGTLSMLDPADDAGHQFVCTVKRLSS